MRLERGQVQGPPLHLHCIAVVRLPLPYPATTGSGATRCVALAPSWTKTPQNGTPLLRAQRTDGRRTGSPLHCPPVACRFVSATRVSGWCRATAVACPRRVAQDERT